MRFSDLLGRGDGHDDEPAAAFASSDADARSMLTPVPLAPVDDTLLPRSRRRRR